MPLYAAGQRIRGSEINALPQLYRVASPQICSNPPPCAMWWA